MVRLSGHACQSDVLFSHGGLLKWIDFFKFYYKHTLIHRRTLLPSIIHAWIRADIRFLTLQNNTATSIRRDLINFYGNDVTRRQHVANWVKLFSEGHIGFNDEKINGRPSVEYIRMCQRASIVLDAKFGVVSTRSFSFPLLKVNTLHIPELKIKKN